MSITLTDLFDTVYEAELGAVEALEGHAWIDEVPRLRVRVYEGDALVFVSIHSIGFQGVLVERKSGRRIDIGSSIEAAHQVWAHGLGVDLEGTNDVLIHAFTDKPRLEALLGRLYTRRHVVRSILPYLDDPPVMLRGVRLYPAITLLYEMLRDGALTMELDPTSELPDVGDQAAPSRLEFLRIAPEAAEDMNALYGELRSMLATTNPAVYGEGWRLLELSHHAFELDERVWRAQWAPTIERTMANMPSPFIEFRSIEELERGVQFLPGARFSLNLSNGLLAGVGTRALANCPLVASLTTLKLRANCFGDEDAEALAGSPYLRTLLHLNLANHFMTREGVQALVGSSGLPSLTSLNLKNGCHRPRPDTRRRVGMGDDGAKALAWFCQLPSLKTLNLARNGIGNEGARLLAASRSLASLVSLNLSKNEIGEEGLSALEGSAGLSSLEELIMHHQRTRGR